MESQKSFTVSTYNYKCKSEVSSGQLPQTLRYFSWRVKTLWRRKEEKKGGERRGRNGGEQETLTWLQLELGLQVITGVKRSPAGPEANEPLSPFHLCGGELCHLQIAGEIWFTSLQPPTRLAAKKHWSISANHQQWCRNYLVVFDMGRPVCVFILYRSWFLTAKADVFSVETLTKDREVY